MENKKDQSKNDKIDKPENRRRLFSFFKYPKLRIKYGSFYAFIGLCSVGVLNFSLIFIMLQMLNTTGKEVDVGSSIGERFLQVIEYNHWLVIITLLVLFVLFFAFAFVLANRIAGPMQPLLRHIEELKKGNYTHRTHLRKGDELKPLMSGLNELSESLELKNKN